MNTWHLKYFIEAARQKKLDAAAQKFRVTPSAISQSIRTLESELELKLISHKKRRFELTEAGEALLREAPLLMSELDALAPRIRNEVAVWDGRISFSSPNSLFTGKLYDSVIRLKKQTPNGRLTFRVGVAAVVRKLVLNGEVQFGVVVDDDQLGDFSSTPLYTGEFFMVARRKNMCPLEQGLVVTDENKIEVQEVQKQLRKGFKSTAPIQMELQSWTLIKNICSQLDVVGYVPDYVVESELKAGKLFRVRDKIKSYRYEIKVIWPKNKAMPRSAIELIKEIGR